MYASVLVMNMLPEDGYFFPWWHLGLGLFFFTHSASEVKICTIYGGTSLQQWPAWVEFCSEVQLGAYHAAAAFLRRFVGERRRFQLQLVPRR